MPNLASDFYRLLTAQSVPSPAPAAPLADDECFSVCPHCRRETVFKLSSVVAGWQWYQCQAPGCECLKGVKTR